MYDDPAPSRRTPQPLSATSHLSCTGCRVSLPYL